ncbi:MAG: hypothetical protein IJI68_05940 [Eggerthellaceae bacterium]|jgi:hypothetical protein|nr:hypothetical protein [Eggerthellaceae bacterium]
MSNAFDHLHIKRHTAGSSNELSFDVLDAARDGYVPKKKRFGRLSGPQMLRPVRQEEPPPKVVDAEPTVQPEPREPVQRSVANPAATTRPSYHRAVGKSALAAQEEVTSRKRDRRWRSIRIGIIASVVAVAMMVATAYVGYQHYEEMQLFKGKFDSLVQLFVEADAAIPLTDTFMADPFGATEEEISEMQEATSKAALSLQQLEDERALAVPYAINEQDELALERLGEASSNRQDMMAAALKAAEVVSYSEVQSSEVNAVWHKVLGADEAARAATAAANAANTDEAIKDAREQTVAVRKQMQSILEEMEKLASKRVDLDLADHIAYLQKRIESLDFAIATSDALLKSDKEDAAIQNEAYNEADRQAAQIAEKLPLSAEQTVEEAYEEQVRACISDYESARNKAIESDALIRQYLRG